MKKSFGLSVERTGAATTFSLESLPLWKGVGSRPGVYEHYPFSLGWDTRGFIRQVSPGDVKRSVVESYADDAYSYITAPPGASAWANRLAEDCIGFIRRTYGSLSGKRVLDIGAGSPYVGDQFTTNDGAADYLILDPSVREAARNPKVRVVREYFSQEHCRGQEFDLIISLNCLEHVDDPVGFLLDIRAIASGSDAKVVLVFPDIEQQFRNGDLNALLHEHLNYFTMGLATSLLERCGFRVLQAKTDCDCLYLFLEPGGEPAIAHDLAMDSILETAATRFGESLQYAYDQICKDLSTSETVALHGATNGLNNALYLMGLHRETKLLVFDGDETKAGKYLPANPNSIRCSRDPEYARVGSVLVASLTFFKEIREFLISQQGLEPSKVVPLFPEYSS